MRLSRRLLVLVVPLLFVVCGIAADESLSEKVDALFGTWAKPDSPGAVCAVIRDGKVIHARGYGMEDLEHDVPLSTDSVFYIASTSKQFTAASIALLVLDGKLSLDDDIRQHLPEMAEQSVPIRVRHLIHHTSGMRDYFDLLALTGWTDTDYFNNDMVVKLLARQRSLNFEPGARHLYSNSNYVLLAEIVKRVSGKSLRQFADERIFQPLGMTRTHFDDDYRQIVKHRVLSYTPKRGGGWQQLLKEFDGYGDGNLLTTVGDLARWDENFTTGKVGGPEFLKLILTRGTLNDGKSIDYAFGLGHATYRGIPTVQHAGAFKGFRTEMMRFPAQKFTVIVLGNATTFNPGQMAQKVADLYLADQFKTPARGASSMSTAATHREPVKIDPEKFDAYVGKFEFKERPGFTLTIRRDSDRYFSHASGQTELEIFPSSETTFFYRAIDAQLTFHREPDGRVQRVTFTQGGPHDAIRVEPSTLNAGDLSVYTGRYRSDEVGATYTLTLEKGQLVVKHDRMPSQTIEPTARDRFSSRRGTVIFERDEKGEVRALKFSSGRAENVRFEREKPES